MDVVLRPSIYSSVLLFCGETCNLKLTSANTQTQACMQQRQELPPRQSSPAASASWIDDYGNHRAAFSVQTAASATDGWKLLVAAVLHHSAMLTPWTESELAWNLHTQRERAWKYASVLWVWWLFYIFRAAEGNMLLCRTIRRPHWCCFCCWAVFSGGWFSLDRKTDWKKKSPLPLETDLCW